MLFGCVHIWQICVDFRVSVIFESLICAKNFFPSCIVVSIVVVIVFVFLWCGPTFCLHWFFLKMCLEMKLEVVCYESFRVIFNEDFGVDEGVLGEDF